MFENYNENENLNDEVTEEVAPLSELDETVEAEVQESELVIGVVTNCVRLNIREEPNISAPIIAEVNVLSELIVDLEKVAEKWYSVCTEAGIEGFCMKKFVAIKQ